MPLSQKVNCVQYEGHYNPVWSLPSCSTTSRLVCWKSRLNQRAVFWTPQTVHPKTKGVQFSPTKMVPTRSGKPVCTSSRLGSFPSVAVGSGVVLVWSWMMQTMATKRNRLQIPPLKQVSSLFFSWNWSQIGPENWSQKQDAEAKMQVCHETRPLGLETGPEGRRRYTARLPRNEANRSGNWTQRGGKKVTFTDTKLSHLALKLDPSRTRTKHTASLPWNAATWSAKWTQREEQTQCRETKPLGLETGPEEV